MGWVLGYLSLAVIPWETKQRECWKFWDSRCVQSLIRESVCDLPIFLCRTLMTRGYQTQHREQRLKTISNSRTLITTSHVTFVTPVVQSVWWKWLVGCLCIDFCLPFVSLSFTLILISWPLIQICFQTNGLIIGQEIKRKRQGKEK